ncbi:MAG: hypothetical protein LBD15_02575 [Holosporales bacterium]|nr:hypothetical protein [Holosporales bacterium]
MNNNIREDVFASMREGYVFALHVAPAVGVLITTLEKELQALLTACAQDNRTEKRGIMEEDLAHIRCKIMGIFSYLQDNVQQVALTIAALRGADCPVELIERYPELIEKVSLKEIREAAQLVETPELVTLLLPKKA